METKPKADGDPGGVGAQIPQVPGAVPGMGVMPPGLNPLAAANPAILAATSQGLLPSMSALAKLQQVSAPARAAKGGGARFKKAPDAPKRFKSAFIIFSAEKHKEIKKKFAAEGRSEKTTDIAKLVSEAWREMPSDERETWEEKARQDKARYEMERSLYKGPWKIPANKRTPKDPSAPKRPMSAFLAFSNKRRAALKRQHPDATNADLSKMLSKTWKEAPPELKSKYTEEEAELRAKYKVEMAKWRKKVAEEKKAERKEREAMAMQAAEARQNDALGGANGGEGGNGQPDMQGGFPNAAAGLYGNPYANAMPPGAPGNFQGGPGGGGGGGGGGGSGDSNSFGAGFPNLMATNPFAAQQLLSGAAATPQQQQQLLQQLLAGQQIFQQQQHQQQQPGNNNNMGGQQNMSQQRGGQMNAGMYGQQQGMQGQQQGGQPQQGQQGQQPQQQQQQQGMPPQGQQGQQQVANAPMGGPGMQGGFGGMGGEMPPQQMQPNQQMPQQQQMQPNQQGQPQGMPMPNQQQQQHMQGVHGGMGGGGGGGPPMMAMNNQGLPPSMGQSPNVPPMVGGPDQGDGSTGAQV